MERYREFNFLLILYLSAFLLSKYSYSIIWDNFFLIRIFLFKFLTLSLEDGIKDCWGVLPLFVVSLVFLIRSDYMTSLASSFTRPSKWFQKIPPAVKFPYLIELQKNSYNAFLQAEVAPNERKQVGLQAVFNSVFPISHFAGTASVEFVSYSFEEPKYTVDECRQRGMSFAAPLKVVIRLVVWDLDKETEVKSIRDVKEQEVYFGEIPLMTDDGTFIINGTERVVVSQLHRSSGVFFDHDKGKNSTSGKFLYTARVIPYRGSWLDFEFDAKDILIYVLTVVVSFIQQFFLKLLAILLKSF